MPIIDYFITKDSSYKAYNVTPDNSIELLALAEKVKEISAEDLPIIINNESMGMEYSGDNSRLKREMRDLKFTPIDSAIEKLYRWYFENKSSINKESLLVDK
jgi:GDP-L-fucose synthase